MRKGGLSEVSLHLHFMALAHFQQNLRCMHTHFQELRLLQTSGRRTARESPWMSPNPSSSRDDTTAVRFLRLLVKHFRLFRQVITALHKIVQL
mmetsp:Transcript_33440/g.61696  ORF Transcript_33440/g.61696 Transcript_33440/m.61696 type:complete len:93 (-) Transcript_33440:584-862(-)